MDRIIQIRQPSAPAAQLQPQECKSEAPFSGLEIFQFVPFPVFVGHDFLDLCLGHVQLFIANTADFHGAAVDFQCFIQREVSLFQKANLFLKFRQSLFK